MPDFYPGEQKTATALMTNPKAKGFDYDATLFLGVDAIVKSSKTFHLESSESKSISFPIAMPSMPGSFSVYLSVSSGGQDLVLYQGEDIQILVPNIEIIKAYIRKSSPSVSELYSGWTSFGIGGELNLAQFGHSIQVGVLVRNPTPAPLVYMPTIYNYHWIEPNNYTTTYYHLPQVLPKIFPPAPTGLPYSGGALECDSFCPPGATLNPGKTGFVYTELFTQSRRWNNVYLQVSYSEYNLGSMLLYSGWYSY